MKNLNSLVKIAGAALLPGSLSFALEYAQKIKWLGRTWEFFPPATTPYILELGIAYALFSHIMEKTDGKEENKSQLTFDKGLLLVGTSITVTYLSPQISWSVLSMNNIDPSTAVKCTLLVGGIHFLISLKGKQNKLKNKLKGNITTPQKDAKRKKSLKKNKPFPTTPEEKQAQLQTAKDNWKIFTRRRLERLKGMPTVKNERASIKNTHQRSLLDIFIPPTPKIEAKRKRRVRKSAPLTTSLSKQKDEVASHSHRDLSILPSSMLGEKEVIMSNTASSSVSSSSSPTPSDISIVSDSSPTAPTENTSKPSLLEIEASKLRVLIEDDGEDSTETTDDEFKPNARVKTPNPRSIKGRTPKRHSSRRNTPKHSRVKGRKFFDNLPTVDSNQVEMLAKKHKTQSSDTEDFRD